MNLVLAHVAIPLVIILSNVPLSSVAEAATTSATTSSATTMLIKHLVIIFQENIPFDHYFGTYPHAANPSGQPNFRQLSNDTSADINNLIISGRLLDNPNQVI